jgi:hypothetical protein
MFEAIPENFRSTRVRLAHLLRNDGGRSFDLEAVRRNFESRAVRLISNLRPSSAGRDPLRRLLSREPRMKFTTD